MSLHKNAQSSMEYLVIVGFSLFMIIPLILFSVNELGSQKQAVTGEQLYKIGRTLIDAAQNVHYQGEPAKLTIDIRVPGQVQNVIVSEKEILFFYSTNVGTDSVAVVSPVNISGTIPRRPGLYSIEVRAEGDGVVFEQQS